MDLAIMTQKKKDFGFPGEGTATPTLTFMFNHFHRIPWACAVMECIQWVAWRTSSVWTFVSLSWCLHAFGSKSSDAMPWAKESTEFDSPFQGEKVSVARSGWIECLMERPSTYPAKPCWNPLSLSMEGGEMNGNDNDMNCMLVLAFCIYSSLHSHHRQHLTKRGRSGRLFLVYMLGLTTSGDGFWVILPWQYRERAKSFAPALRFRLSQGHLTSRYIKIH